MSGGIRPRTNRMAFRSLSTSNEECINVECSPPSPCPGSIPSSSYMSAHGQSMLKEDIMQEIRQDVLAPITDILHTLLVEIQEIKKVTNKQCKCYINLNGDETFDRGVRAECETVICSETEPKHLLQDNMQEDQVYEDLSKLTPRKVRTQSIDNKTYGCAEITTEAKKPCNDSDRQTKRKQREGYDNVIVQRSAFQSNSLQTRVKSVAVQPRPRSAINIIRPLFDERECLANALQFHIGDLVDGIVFHESELPDCLLAEGCLTEDECATVRKLRDRKDQVRVLLSLIKGRDLRVLKGFMKHINQHNPDVAEMITNKFEANKCDGLRGKLCALCQLTKQFNVKHVADSLWAIQVINDELYNRIIYSEAPVGAQSELWNDVICSLKSLDKQNADAAQKRLIAALSSKNLFTHLAEGINNMLIKSHGILTCACEPKFILPKRPSCWGATTSGESFLPDSSSDSASNDVISFDGTENEDTQDKKIDAIDGMSRITEITEDPTSPTTNVTDEATIYERSYHQKNSAVCNVSQKFTSTPQSNSEPIQTDFNPPMAFLNKPIPPKKPMPAPKPPIPPKKPEIMPNIENPSTDKTLLSRSGSDRITESDANFSEQKCTDLQTENILETKENKIPPLPEKKRKYLPNYV